MNRTSIKEYILPRQEDYLGEHSRQRRSQMLDEVRRMTGLSRQYAIRLLRGSRRYRVHPGRGKSYGPAEEKLLVGAWEGAGCQCAKYLKADIGRWLRNLGELQNARPEAARRTHPRPRYPTDVLGAMSCAHADAPAPAVSYDSPVPGF